MHTQTVVIVNSERSCSLLNIRRIFSIKRLSNRFCAVTSISYPCFCLAYSPALISDVFTACDIWCVKCPLRDSCIQTLAGQPAGEVTTLCYRRISHSISCSTFSIKFVMIFPSCMCKWKVTGSFKQFVMSNLKQNKFQSALRILQI